LGFFADTIFVESSKYNFCLPDIDRQTNFEPFASKMSPSLLQGPMTTGSTGAFVGVAVGVGAGVTDGVGVVFGVAEGIGAAIAIPLFQTNFFPFLMQVYFLPA
jgi:hypothetical protein